MDLMDLGSVEWYQIGQLLGLIDLMDLIVDFVVEYIIPGTIIIQYGITSTMNCRFTFWRSQLWFIIY